MTIVWTKHGGVRQKEWQRKLGITKERVEDVVRNPQQIVPGDLDLLIAQSKFEGGLLRILYVESGNERRIVTVYWTSKVERYWKE